MTPAKPLHTVALPTVTTHRDGCAVWFDGAVVEVFPGLLAASIGRQLAKEASAMLAACLASDPSRRDEL